MSAGGIERMCFSATTSFAAAATTAAIGAAALKHVVQARQFPLALVPMLFASQQAVEGVLWLQLPPEGNGAHVAPLAFAFLIFAEVVWPAYAAIAVLLIEPGHLRRMILAGLAILGTLLSAHLLGGLMEGHASARVDAYHIVYGGGIAALSWKHAAYLVCTCSPLLVSSHRAVRLFGIAVLIAFAISAVFYLAAFISVWCFFAAANSTLLYLHFRREPLALRRG